MVKREELLVNYVNLFFAEIIAISSKLAKRQEMNLRRIGFAECRFQSQWFIGFFHCLSKGIEDVLPVYLEELVSCTNG